MGGFLELSYGLSFSVVTILVSTFQFLSSKSLYQERSQYFPGVRPILKTYPNFLLSSLVTFPHYIWSSEHVTHVVYETLETVITVFYNQNSCKCLREALTI